MDEDRAEVVGDIGEVDVSVEENPTTGFRWMLCDPPAGVALLGDAYATAEDMPPGARRVRIFRLKVDRPGRFELRFKLKRRWEAEAIRHRVVELVIRQANEKPP